MIGTSKGAGRGPGSYGARTKTPVTGAVNVGGARRRGIPNLDIPDLPGATCKGYEGDDVFFPGPGRGAAKKIELAKAMCLICPVRQKCLDYALNWDRDHPDYYDRIQGVWGGTTEAERKLLLKEEKNAVA